MYANIQRYGTVKFGIEDTVLWKCYVTRDGKFISPCNDVPLYDRLGVVDCIVETPKDSVARYDLMKNEFLTPLQFSGKTQYAHIRTVFTTGYLPQTFQRNRKKTWDPLYVVDVSNIKKDVGTVFKAKVFGALKHPDDRWEILVADEREYDENRLAAHGVEMLVHANTCTLASRETALACVEQAHAQWRDVNKNYIAMATTDDICLKRQVYNTIFPSHLLCNRPTFNIFE